MYTYKCGHLLHNWSLSKMWENHKCKMWPLVWIYCFWAWKKKKKAVKWSLVLRLDNRKYNTAKGNGGSRQAICIQKRMKLFFLHSKCTACFISTSRFELLRKSKCTACVDKGSQQAQQDPTDQQERRGITSKPGFIQEGTVLYACHVWTLHRAGLWPQKTLSHVPTQICQKRVFCPAAN